MGNSAMTTKAQATKANQAQVELHIQRQRLLGERMIGDTDAPRKWDLIISLAAVVAIVLIKA